MRCIPTSNFQVTGFSMKMCRDASYLLYYPNYLRNKHSQQERLECTRVPWLIHWEFPSSFQVWKINPIQAWTLYRKLIILTFVVCTAVFHAVISSGWIVFACLQGLMKHYCAKPSALCSRFVSIKARHSAVGSVMHA